MSGIFGGSKNKSKQQSQSQQYSGNYAYPAIQTATNPLIDIGNKATSMISNLLGLGNTAAADSAFDDYKNSTGFKSTIDTGMRAVNTNQAVAGQLGSGKTLKALTQFGQETNQKYFGDFLARLLGLSTQGMDALKTLAAGGQYSSGSSSSTGSSSGSSSGGVSSLIGAIL